MSGGLRGERAKPGGIPGVTIGAPRATIPDRMDAELRAQGGTIESLMLLAEAICEAANDVAIAVNHVAQSLDEERRGPASVNRRQDAVAVGNHIGEYLASAIVDPERGAFIVEHVQSVIDEVRKHVRMPDPLDKETGLSQKHVETGRKIAAELGRPPAPPRVALPSLPVAAPPGHAKGRGAAARGALAAKQNRKAGAALLRLEARRAKAKAAKAKRRARR